MRSARLEIVDTKVVKLSGCPLTIEYLYQIPFIEINEIVTRNKPKTLCINEFSSLKKLGYKVKLIRAHGGCLGTRSR